MGGESKNKKRADVPRKRCFMDISVDSEIIGRIVLELYSDLVPKAAKNFKALCTGEYGKSKISGVPLHYKNSCFHKVVKGFMIQGGDIFNRGGRGGESIYGPTFEDEESNLKHERPFLVTMANKGPNTNSSQFFITTVPTPHLDGKHVIVGEVVEGTEHVLSIENIAVDGRYRPVRPVVVEKCGELSLVKVKRKSSKTGTLDEDMFKVKTHEDEYLDPGVLPPPEVMDTGPNWLDRTIPYIPPSERMAKNVKRKLIPWDIGYVSPTRKCEDKSSPIPAKLSPDNRRRRRRRLSPSNNTVEYHSPTHTQRRSPTTEHSRRKDSSVRHSRRRDRSPRVVDKD